MKRRKQFNYLTNYYLTSYGRREEVMALPKRKFSKSRRDKRRAHWKINGPQLSACPHCGKLKLSHRICPYCGYYKGRQVIELKEKKEKGKS